MRPAGGSYASETVDAIWDLVVKGLLTVNDTFPRLVLGCPRPRRQRKPIAGR